ncbi:MULTISPECIES: VanZ family protein [Bacillus]|uniref:VanZ family protein n=1 Tax=Bacillus TaxID=1386 RepID=UPI0002EFE868|nr:MULTISPECIES: VanZ family protein [Bacillus]
MFFGVLLIGSIIASILSAIIYLPIYIAQRKKKIPFLRHFIHYVFIGCCIVISFATLFLGGVTFNPDYYFLNLHPFIWISEVYTMGWARMIEQLILNILMFVPLCILLPIVFKGLRSFWKTTIVALCMTISIEFIQYFTGRSADIDDVIMNVCGGMIGYFLFSLLNHLFRNKAWWKQLNGMQKRNQNS